MAAVLEIASHENIKQSYLRLNISEKINFNIIGRSFFKGMAAIKDIQLEYKDGKLIFIFKNKKNLVFSCSLKEFEKISRHINS